MRLLRAISVVLFFLLGVNAGAQEIKVKSFSMQMMEVMTEPMQRRDNNGNICALIKVIIPSAQAAFEGNLIGKCDFKTSEYWCYLSPGSKHLKIKYPGCEPLMVNFVDLMGRGVKSKQIYELCLQVPQAATFAEAVTITGNITCEPRKGSKGENYWNFDKFASSVKLYHNYHYGKYAQMVEGKDMDKAVLDHKLRYSVSGVHVGDSLTVISYNQIYTPMTTIHITADMLGGDNFNIQVMKRREPRRGRLIDSWTERPLGGIKVSGMRYVWGTSDTYVPDGILCMTDSAGYFTIPDCPVDEECVIHFDLPSNYNTSHREYINRTAPNSHFIFRASRYVNWAIIKKGDFDIADISAVCDNPEYTPRIEVDRNNDKQIKVIYPVSEGVNGVTIRCKGHKPVHVSSKYGGKAIKLKKGDENAPITNY